ncbi:replication stress response regulator SDE2 [Protopterus annectens]|uniref:replication stress response regulator SDE2 n=1 Tax=Protopterus annectens TaxID=7888 RepID=UPI001CFBD8AC|nr:replication stress response regulator SDE2 [Protopterus annectens]
MHVFVRDVFCRTTVVAVPPEWKSVGDLACFFSCEKGVPVEDFYVKCNGRLVTTDEELHHGVVYILEPRLCGGKGGFGSMLRALGAQIEKTTNREACRDLSGRRLRDVNHEKAMAEWIKKQAEREADREQRRIEKLKRKLAEPKHYFTDVQYEQQCHELSERLDDSVFKGMQASCSSVVSAGEGTSQKRPSEGLKHKTKSAKKKCLWLGVEGLEAAKDEDSNEDTDDSSDISDDSDESSSSSVEPLGNADRSGDFSSHSSFEERPGCVLDEYISKEISAESNSCIKVTEENKSDCKESTHEITSAKYADSAVETSVQKEDRCSEVTAEENECKETPSSNKATNEKSQNKEGIINETSVHCSELADGHAAKTEEDKTILKTKEDAEMVVNSSTENGRNSQVSISDSGPLDLMFFNSAAELETLGLERLKAELMHLGLKCGGTLQERTSRLFSVRGLSKNQIDPRLFAKPPKGKK